MCEVFTSYDFLGLFCALFVFLWVNFGWLQLILELILDRFRSLQSVLGHFIGLYYLLWIDPCRLSSCSACCVWLKNFKYFTFLYIKGLPQWIMKNNASIKTNFVEYFITRFFLFHFRNLKITYSVAVTLNSVSLFSHLRC